MIGTFAAVLFFTMLKEAFEDFQRYKQDKELNNKRTQLFDQETGHSTDLLWQDIRVGEIVRVEKDQEIPADLLLLAAPKDVVFLSTMNLDGETNLKERVLPIDGFSEGDLRTFSGEVKCDEPNENLEFWNGNIHSGQLDKVTNCSMKNLALRGCTLKNTDYAYGMVLYVGPETKIFMNSKKAPRKVSNIMAKMNYMLYTVFAFQILLILAFAALSMQWTSQHSEGHTYLDLEVSGSFS